MFCAFNPASAAMTWDQVHCQTLYMPCLWEEPALKAAQQQILLPAKTACLGIAHQGVQAHLLLRINGCCGLQKQMALQLIGGEMMLIPERKYQVFVARNLEKMGKN